MAAPAIDSYVDRRTSTHYWVQRSWVPTDPYLQVDYNRPYSEELVRRPATVINLKRADGTRPPSGWWSRWLRTMMPFKHLRFQIGLTGDTTLVWSAEPVPVADQLNAWNVSAGVGAQWTNDASPGSFPANVENLARTKVLNKLADNKAQLGSALTEFRGTVETVTQAAEYAAEAIRGIAKATRTSPKDVSSFLRNVRSAFTPSQQLGEDITNLWLAKQYGLRPLLDDIQDAGQSLDEALFERDQSFLMVVKGGVRIRETRSFTLHSQWNPGFRATSDFQVSTGCWFSAVYEVPRTGTRRFQQVGLGNIPAAWWEAVRFSWALDHVANVGSWLTSLMAADGTLFREGSMSRIQKVEAVGEFRFSPDPGVKLISGFDRSVLSFENGRFERTVLNQAGIMPAIMPSVKPRLGVEFMSNALSVLSQMGAARSGPRII